MRGATPRAATSMSASNFNPRSSCEERRAHAKVAIWKIQFQSTLLMRGATCTHPRCRSLCSYFNPRSSCEERLHCRASSSTSRNFNPRSSCEERLAQCFAIAIGAVFQSTLLMRGATVCNVYVICTHHFNPRSSCEERRPCRNDYNQTRKFQSTLLMRGANQGRCAATLR